MPGASGTCQACNHIRRRQKNSKLIVLFDIGLKISIEQCFLRKGTFINNDNQL